MMFLYVAIAGAFGAISRYLLDRLVKRALPGAFPWGTFIVNISGSFALGLLIGWADQSGLPDLFVIAAGTGFLGAYTTFSGWMVQTIQLGESGETGKAFLNILMSLITGIAAFFIAVTLV